MARLTDTPATDVAGTWSPDCSRTAFASDQESPERSHFDIYVMNADGSGVVNPHEKCIER
jgi:Tol biopolymer transport system component